MTEEVYWAWRDDKKKKFRHIYPSRFLVEMCSPDKFKRAEADGEGKLVEVTITEKQEVT